MRRTAREVVNARAWIEIGAEAQLHRCRLVDISQNGARLIVEDGEITPDSFDLLLAKFGQPRHRCSVVWKHGNEIGVEFVAPAIAAASSADA